MCYRVRGRVNKFGVRAEARTHTKTRYSDLWYHEYFVRMIARQSGQSVIKQSF
jgi:hypothetical protein